MKPSDDYYYQLDAAHQREVDWQAGYEIALDEVATEIDNDLKQGDQTHYHDSRKYCVITIISGLPLVVVQVMSLIDKRRLRKLQSVN